VRGYDACPGIWLVGASALHTVSRRRLGACRRRRRRRRWWNRARSRWRRRGGRRRNVGRRWGRRLWPVLRRRRVRIRLRKRRRRRGRTGARGGHIGRSEPHDCSHHQERAATPGRRPPQAGEPGTPV
jgi:hypothetical protein